MVRSETISGLKTALPAIGRRLNNIGITGRNRDTGQIDIDIKHRSQR